MQAHLCDRSLTAAAEFPDIQNYGVVSDSYALLEWSAGGIVHTHTTLWITGALRIDNVDMPRETRNDDDDTVVHVDTTPEYAIVRPQAEAARVLATCWDRVYTKFDVGKHLSNAEHLSNADTYLKSLDRCPSTVGQK